MDIYNHRRLSNALLDMQRAMEAFEPFLDEESLSSEDEECLFEEETWEKEGDETYYDLVPYSEGVNARGGGLTGVRKGYRRSRSNNAQQDGKYPPTDMFETPDAYELDIDLPGFDKKDIKIEMPNNRTLTLKGTGKPENKKKVVERKRKSGYGNKKRKVGQQQQKQPTADSPKWLLDERTFDGDFTRNYGFPIPINGKNIQASYENGVLKIAVPKYNKDVVTQIQIE